MKDRTRGMCYRVSGAVCSLSVTVPVPEEGYGVRQVIATTRRQTDDDEINQANAKHLEACWNLVEDFGGDVYHIRKLLNDRGDQ